MEKQIKTKPVTWIFKKGIEGKDHNKRFYNKLLKKSFNGHCEIYEIPFRFISYGLVKKISH